MIFFPFIFVCFDHCHGIVYIEFFFSILSIMVNFPSLLKSTLFEQKYCFISMLVVIYRFDFVSVIIWSKVSPPHLSLSHTHTYILFAFWVGFCFIDTYVSYLLTNQNRSLIFIPRKSDLSDQYSICSVHTCIFGFVS